MTHPAIIGIDLAKRVFQIHGAGSEGVALFKKRLSRAGLMAFLAEIPPTVIAMEACGSAHFWARLAEEHGHEVRIVPTQYVKAYVKRHKNDAVDAEAICEAASRRTMRFVPVKSEDQQSLRAVHRIRSRLVRDRTALVNEIRGLLLEFGFVFRYSVPALRAGVSAPLSEDSTDELPPLMRNLLKELHDELRYLDGRIEAMNRRIREINAESPACQALMSIPGIGPLNASAFMAAIGDASNFRKGRDLAAWLGLVPQQHSSAGKVRLGSISRKGDAYLRTILVHGARAYIWRVRRRMDRPRTLFEKWIAHKLAANHINLVTVAVANKLARFIWATLRTGKAFYSPPLRTA